MPKGNRINHAKKWMRYDDWETWLLKEWYPFKMNEFYHLKLQVKLSLWLSAGILIAVITKLVIDLLWG